MSTIGAHAVRCSRLNNAPLTKTMTASVDATCSRMVSARIRRAASSQGADDLCSPVCGRMVTPQVVNVHLDFGCSASPAASSSGIHARAAEQPQLVPHNGVIRKIISGGVSTITRIGSTSVKRNRDDAANDEKSTLHSTPSKTSDSSQSRKSKSTSTSASGRSSGLKRPRVGETSRSFLEAAKPLPELVRPRSLDDFVGQEHLLGKGALLRGLIDADRIGSAIFWGPPARSRISRLAGEGLADSRTTRRVQARQPSLAL